MQNPEEKKSPISINQLSKEWCFRTYKEALQAARAKGWNAVLSVHMEDHWEYVPYNNVRKNKQDENSK